MPSDLLKYRVRPDVIKEARTLSARPESPSLPAPGAVIELPEPPPGTGGQVSEFGFLLGILRGTRANTLTFPTTASPHVDFAGRYSVDTDDLGSPGHTVSGPNLIIKNLEEDRETFRWRDIGQGVFQIGDASLAHNSVSHAIQLRAYNRSGSTTAVGFGTGVQVYADDTANAQQEMGNIQFFWIDPNPASLDSGFIIRAKVAGASTIMLSSSGANVKAEGKLLATGGLGVGNSVVASTPGSIIRRSIITDADGLFIGYLPIYDAIT